MAEADGRVGGAAVVTRQTSITLRAQDVSHDSNLVDATAYQALGGLDAQIHAIRALVELPLTRPELFDQYGLQPPRGVLPVSYTHLTLPTNREV